MFELLKKTERRTQWSILTLEFNEILRGFAAGTKIEVFLLLLPKRLNLMKDRELSQF